MAGIDRYGSHAADLDAHKVAHGRPYSGITYTLQIPGVPITGITITHAEAADILAYDPFLTITSITIDQFIFEVTTAGAAGKKIRAGIYRADKNWQPTDLVVASPEMAIDAIAVVTQDIADTVLTPGRYLIARVSNDTATYRTLKLNPPFRGIQIGLGANPNIYRLNVAKAYAALADPGTAWDTIATGVDGHYYKMFFRILTP